MVRVSHAYTTVLPATIQSIRRSWEEQKAITEILHYNHMAEDRPRRRLHRGRTDRPRTAATRMRRAYTMGKVGRPTDRIARRVGRVRAGDGTPDSGSAGCDVR